MVRARFDYPDLDVLDSPLMSSTAFTSFSGIPGSAIAENIFNDPDSWQENGDTDADDLAWLVEEIEKFKTNSADVCGAFDPAVYTKRIMPSLTPPTGLKGIDRSSTVRPISITRFFEPSKDEDIQDQISKILDAGGIQYHVRPLSSTLSPSSSKSTYTPLKINTSTVASSIEDGPSPVNLHSSITMSFLEWYGIYPDSEINLRSLRQQYRKSVNSKNPASMALSPRYAIRLSPPSSSRDTFSHPPVSCASFSLSPGFEPPPRLPRSQTPPTTSSQHTKLSAVSSTSPPPYSRTPSPVGSRSNSRSRFRSGSNSRSRSPPSTSVQGVSKCDSNSTTRRRRLPSIPSEAFPLLPLFSSPAPLPKTLPPSRPLTSGRPSIAGPAGPRRRSSSRMSPRSTSTQGASLSYRPAVLRI